MTEEVEEVKVALAILEQALTTEQAGRKFYIDAAQAAEDSREQEIFNALASDEQNHYKLINQQRQALSQGNQWISLSEVKPVEIALDKPIFPQGIESLKKSATTSSREREALLFGLDIESKSYDLYRHAAQKISAPLGKEMFQFLAGEEKGHFNILMMRYEAQFGPSGWSS